MGKIRRILERRGWLEQRPLLGKPEVTELSRGIQTTYPLTGYEEGVTLKLYWQAFAVDGDMMWWWTKTKWPPRDAEPAER